MKRSGQDLMDAGVFHILLVEDSPSDAELLQHTLQAIGAGRFEFTWVECLQDALSRVRQEDFDVLLLDLSLPDSSGADTFRSAHEAAPRLPIVVLTGVSDERLGLAAVHEGIQDYLIKGQADGHQIARAIRYSIERKDAEVELSRQREWLRVTLTSIGDAVLATDTAGRITFLNPVAARLTGWTEEQALGRPVQEVFRIINERTRQRPEDIAARVLREGLVVSLANHTALVTPDGREIPIEDSAAPMRDSAGNLTGVVLVFHDVTEERRAQEALQQSEQRVKLKLESILSPEGDIGKLELGDILDTASVQGLIEDLYKLAHVPMFIVDLKGALLAGVGWQEICTKFHRVHPEACRHCMESDLQLTAGVAPGEFRLYKCKNNMWDVATPLTIGGQHVGNLFSGQFFFESEPLDYELFRAQACRYGFPEEEYLAALEAVPRLSRQAVETGMALLMKLGHTLSLLSYSNIKLARSLAERDALTASLRESGERLKRAQEIAHLGSWQLDLANNHLSWSDEVYRIFGFEPQECAASNEIFFEAVHPDDREAVEAAYRTSVEHGESYEITHRILRGTNREVRWVQEKSEHIRDASGKVVRSVGMIQDITERKQAEEALRQSEALYRGIARNLPDGAVFAVDREMRHLVAEGALLAAIGQEKEKLEGRTLHEALDRDSLASIEPLWLRALAGETISCEASYRGRTLWTQYVPLRDENGAVVAAMAVWQDISERKRVEEQLRHSQKLESIGLLAGGIAHDFNNLLVGIIGNASLAEDMLSYGSPAAEALRRIARSGEQAAHLTRQMLAYAGKGRFVVEPVNLSGLAADSAPLLESSISKKITVRLRLDSEIPCVESDPSQMQQVFMNLTLNAAEAIGSELGVISVTTGQMSVDAAFIRDELPGWTIEPGRYVFLEVRDTGCGMDEATKAKIFDPFFTTKFQGRGLGLAAVAGIVRAHKGAIKLTTAPGSGASFRVLLPAMVSGAAIPAEAAQRQEDLRGKGTVLIVDDEQVVRDVAKTSLERQGYEVLVAENGSAAIEAVRLHGDRIRLVVLDLSMPRMSGEEILPHLRKLKPDLEVVVSSGYSEAEALGFFRGARVSGFIQKPYTVRELARLVKSVLA